MNVLFLSELYHPYGGGAELATYLYAKLLDEAGLKVRVVTSRFSADPTISKRGNSAIYRLNLSLGNKSSKYSILPRFDILFSSFMRKMIKWADLVYVPRLWYSAIPWAKNYRKPIMVHVHDYAPICPTSVMYDASVHANCISKTSNCSLRCLYAHEKNESRGFVESLISMAINSTVGPYLGRLLRLSDAVICVSKAQRDTIVEKMPAISGRVQVIYNPLPELPYREIECQDFGYLGGPSYLKGFHVLSRALARVEDVRTKVHAAGFATSGGQYVEKMHQSISIYGKLSGEPLEEFWRRISALIVPSICAEPLPYVVSEAAQRGRVLIASRSGGIPEQVEGCNGAYLFEPGDYKHLAETIDLIKSMNRETLADLGFQNRETFLRRFSNTSTVEKFIHTCENLVRSD